QIKLACARRKIQQTNETNEKLNSNRSRSISFGKTTEIVVKAKSMGTLHSAHNSLTRSMKTRSLEVISNLALWSTSIVNIELNKGEHGLGFSVLDYQDPSNPSYSPVIVIRALVPAGVDFNILITSSKFIFSNVISLTATKRSPGTILPSNC
ncbi:unnamed protein product, partial [Adineta steineri]